MAEIYQLKIVLKGVMPPVWRRILVESATLLPDLHKIIQTSMGWMNSHLHQFIHDDIFYAPPSDWDDDMDIIDYSQSTLDSQLKAEGDVLLYEYDFGDNWQHEIVLEKMTDREDHLLYPVCIAGKRACPPEDCGGPWGYQDILEVIADPKHPEYKDQQEWLGEDFDPELFDMDEVNKKLQETDFGATFFEM